MLMPMTRSLREALTAASEARLMGASPERALVQGWRVCSSSHSALIWALRTRMMASFLFSASSKPVSFYLVRPRSHVQVSGDNAMCSSSLNVTFVTA